MISDERLRMAAGEYEQALLSSLPDADECNHSFSPKFEKKMRHLCHKAKYAAAYSVTKRIACAIIAIVLCGSLLMMLNTDVRAAVVGWIKETYNSFTRYFFAGQIEEKPARKAYDFEEVPEGYTFLDRIDIEDSSTILYISPEGFILELSYGFSTDANAFFFKPEDHTHTQEKINGTTMDIYLSNDPQYASSIIWSTNDKVIFIISANCDKDGLIELTQNVHPLK